MPGFIPPHKPVPEDPGPKHRLELCRAAIAGDERFEASELEIARGGTSYTVDTLEELNSNTPDSDLFLILGADVAAGLPRWREPERVLALASPALAGRRGTSQEAVASALATLPGGERACFFEMPTVAISSTMVRERARTGRPIRYLVPDAVADYIASAGLYREAQAG
jgi:nicotinate-nucleotide adenylyltransferase